MIGSLPSCFGKTLSRALSPAPQEALEVGATCLLLDEDTCATNFMIRDARMQVPALLRCACVKVAALALPPLSRALWVLVFSAMGAGISAVCGS